MERAGVDRHTWIFTVQYELHVVLGPYSKYRKYRDTCCFWSLVPGLSILPVSIPAVWVHSILAWNAIISFLNTKILIYPRNHPEYQQVSELHQISIEYRNPCTSVSRFFLLLVSARHYHTKNNCIRVLQCQWVCVLILSRSTVLYILCLSLSVSPSYHRLLDIT